MERKPYKLDKFFIGNEELFSEVFKNPKTIIVFDIDGILAFSAKSVFRDFGERTGLSVEPRDVDGRDFLTKIAKNNNLSESLINGAESGWFDRNLLRHVQPYLYVRSIVRKTMHLYGQERNYVLTSRNSEVTDLTYQWLRDKGFGFKEKNILISPVDDIDRARYKVDELSRLAKIAAWVVFVDDDPRFVNAVLEADIKNCLVVYIPQGKVKPEIRHERLISFERYPEDVQGMYPFMDMLNRTMGILNR